MGQVIDYFWGEDIYDPRICMKYMGWDPMDNVQTWTGLKERIPCFTWDDAGYWLFSLNWTDPLLIAVQKYMNVIGTDINSLMLTTPDPTWILSKIAKMPGTVRIKVIKRDGGGSDNDTRLYSRKAVAYKPWVSPDLKMHGVNKIMEDDFSCKLPEDFYKWYKPTREKYASLAKKEMMAELVSRNKKAQEKKDKEKKRGRPRKN